MTPEAIILKLSGGLGNQMFQYAAAKSLSLQTNRDLYFDVRTLSKYQLHQGFQLNDIFKITERAASPDQIKNVLSLLGSDTALSLSNYIPHYFKSFFNWHTEPSLNYWGDIQKKKNSLYMDGYWQSEQYFSLYEDQIRQSFHFQGELGPNNVKTLEKINGFDVISIHIRRNDYLSAKNSSIYHLCDHIYYQSAIESIAHRVANPFFLVFSDDLKWVKANLNIAYPHEYTNNTGAESYKDMWLMSMCDHNILANSSFSWWGAWLNKNDKKIVIMPSRWFKDDDMQNKIQGLYLKDWETL